MHYLFHVKNRCRITYKPTNDEITIGFYFFVLNTYLFLVHNKRLKLINP